MIKLGDMAKDRITGFKGIVIGITYWLNGCIKIALQSETLKDGKPIDLEWFDDQQMKIIKVKITEKPKKKGGLMPNPKRSY